MDIYLPPAEPVAGPLNLLLINDGQDLVVMRFEDILQQLYASGEILPLVCVGLHCGADRRNEYGTAKSLDFKGRGTKAALYDSFVFGELLPFLHNRFAGRSFSELSFAGFSLGGLSAMDIVWNNPQQFTRVGVFSGSFWWRNKCHTESDFDENIHRIMHQQVKQGGYYPWLRMFFEVGCLDETADRNNNGIIDAVDDTISLIALLEQKGHGGEDIKYLELKDGRHDVATWARAFPAFLKWGWG